MGALVNVYDFDFNGRNEKEIELVDFLLTLVEIVR